MKHVEDIMVFALISIDTEYSQMDMDFKCLALELLQKSTKELGRRVEAENC
ncbi:MAG: hypothetical protein Pg6B_09790 [Candidatus Azobacteroides pseudotrichonymphae]|jgi:hypothetical protein|nr:MAG: hypothetical protein Pg6B_09790 [Candidatus Azobacteroides pseudotrichonymphae]